RRRPQLTPQTGPAAAPGRGVPGCGPCEEARMQGARREQYFQYATDEQRHRRAPQPTRIRATSVAGRARRPGCKARGGSNTSSMRPTSNAADGPRSRPALHVEAEVDHIPIFHHVILALHAEEPLVPKGRLGALAHPVLPGGHLGADEATLEIAVDHAGRLGCLPSGADGPG